jgi:hypothetical protein
MEKSEGKIVIAFPDDGAAKVSKDPLHAWKECFVHRVGNEQRFKARFAEFPIIICSKIREGDSRIIRITDRLNWSEGQSLDHVVIIDDLVQTGGRFNLFFEFAALFTIFIL